ncbi:MAG: 50S ribosomal protein L17 [Candidatus Paceibacterota bacterium]|jgi:large subunit ribosomal protein L17
MRKKQRGRKFHREKDQRKALLKSLSQSLVLQGKITTTLAKAKEAAIYLEKKITYAKKGDLASRRMLSRYFTKKAVDKLISEIGPSFKSRNGGYTRVMKLGPRKSSAAQMAILELVK